MISEEVSNILDELDGIPFSETDLIAAFEADAVIACQENPEDVSMKICLLQVLCMQGRAEEAIALAEEIWNVGDSIDPEIEGRYIFLLNCLGLFDWSYPLLVAVKDRPADQQALVEGLGNLFLACGVGIGSLDMIRDAASFDDFSDVGKDFIRTFVSQMTEAGLSEHFVSQQQIVNDLLRGSQTAYEILMDSERGWPEIEVGVFVGGDGVDRYQLQRKIDEEYEKFYEQAGKEPLDNFMTTVFDIREHWPVFRGEEDGGEGGEE